jgi:2-polyprenyl-3-methyl-5-hydroxy-6-metoxy-1,4-benzoquinol methylase
MENNVDLKTILRCPVCKGNDLISANDDGILCNSCDTKFSCKVGAIDFVSAEQWSQLEELVKLNYDDRYDNSETSGGRQHDVHTYVNSGYCLRLEKELNLKPGAIIADLGCGRGHISQYFIDRGYSVLSVDVVEENLADCSNENKIFATIDHLPIRSGVLDAIICTDVLEHIYPETQSDVIIEAMRVLKPGGKYMVSYPGNILPPHTGNYLLNVVVFMLRLIGFKIDYMATGKDYGGAAHINMRTPWNITRSFRASGFKGKVVPYTNKFLSLPKAIVPFANLLNAPLIRNFFIASMHGLLIKPDKKL